jgi:hypothetical protein
MRLLLRCVPRIFCRSGLVPALVVLLAACSAPSPPPPPLSANEQCLKDLNTLGVGYQRAAVPVANGACAINNPVEVASTGLIWNHPGLVSCQMAEAIDRFTVEVVEPLARRYLGTSVVRLDQIAAFSCRGVVGSGHSGRWSEHATGRAIDIAGFDLEGGGTVSVERDWRDSGAKGAFLRAVAESACSYFSVVLTPESNRFHYNHMHLDIGPYKLCEADGRKVWPHGGSGT